MLTKVECIFPPEDLWFQSWCWRGIIYARFQLWIWNLRLEIWDVIALNLDKWIIYRNHTSDVNGFYSRYCRVWYSNLTLCSYSFLESSPIHFKFTTNCGPGIHFILVIYISIPLTSLRSTTASYKRAPRIYKGSTSTQLTPSVIFAKGFTPGWFGNKNNIM